MPSSHKQGYGRRSSNKPKNVPGFDRTQSQQNTSARTTPTSKRRASFNDTSLDRRALEPLVLNGPRLTTTALQNSDFDDTKPMTYSSLPPSPLPGSSSPTRSLPPPLPNFSSSSQPLSSIWDYLRDELLVSDLDTQQDLKWERVSNFLAIPLAIEKIILFGFVLCFDSFLHTFTILPLRFLIAVYSVCRRTIRVTKQPVTASQSADIIRTLLLVIPVLVLAPNIDVSKIYHSIRGQDTIKLYVIFNALEIADRLFTSFGEDLMDCLFAQSTLTQLSLIWPISATIIRPLVYFVSTTIWTILHALMLIYQLTSLNVAINSFDQSLLTLLVSNQFVEIKGSVFKRFEKDNLFQITCADIVERFQLSLMLIVVAFRILIELSGTEFDGSLLPKSFGWVRGGSMLWTVMMPLMTVLMSEIFVDWLKHAFITKFNHIRPSVYERYTDILCKDLVVGSGWNKSQRKHVFVDQAPFVTRRLGLATLPLAVVAVLVCTQAVGAASSNNALMSTTQSIIITLQWATLIFLFWMCAVIVKIILGLQLVTFAIRRQADTRAREVEDAVNDYGRSAIGETREEKARNNAIRDHLQLNGQENLPHQESLNTPGKKKYLKLEEVTRFTMTKRIW